MHLIPKGTVPTYRNLFSSNEIRDDVDGFHGELDIDLEAAG